MDLFSIVYSSFWMGILEMYFYFYLSYWLRFLLIVCGDVESIPGLGSDKKVQYKNGEVLYGQEPPSGKSTTTECMVNYQLFAVIY